MSNARNNSPGRGANPLASAAPPQSGPGSCSGDTVPVTVVLRHLVQHPDRWVKREVLVELLDMTPPRWAQVQKWGHINTCAKAFGRTGHCATEGCTYAHPAPGRAAEVRAMLGLTDELPLSMGLHWRASVPTEWAVSQPGRTVWCTKDRAGQCHAPDCQYVHIHPERRGQVLELMRQSCTSGQPCPEAAATVWMPQAAPGPAYAAARRYGHVLRLNCTAGAVFIEFASPQEAKRFVSSGAYVTTLGERRCPQQSVGPIHVTEGTRYFPVQAPPAEAPRAGPWHRTHPAGASAPLCCGLSSEGRQDSQGTVSDEDESIGNDSNGSAANSGHQEGPATRAPAPDDFDWAGGGPPGKDWQDELRQFLLDCHVNAHRAEELLVAVALTGCRCMGDVADFCAPSGRNGKPRIADDAAEELDKRLAQQGASLVNFMEKRKLAHFASAAPTGSTHKPGQAAGSFSC
eukprot:TRINITY_DN7906_c0_g1_i2.p1 TRINITY_DN7906_c0_g1~~TRINITY_DN7906_c0_g1_i2.p1  ORF type:complete len:488 (+),score=134.06 TRINITY_DN7906_c0_g1_i2:88-1464(+)